MKTSKSSNQSRSVLIRSKLWLPSKKTMSLHWCSRIKYRNTYQFNLYRVYRRIKIHLMILMRRMIQVIRRTSWITHSIWQRQSESPTGHLFWISRAVRSSERFSNRWYTGTRMIAICRAIEIPLECPRNNITLW
jgi:hypothetical protein